MAKRTTRKSTTRAGAQAELTVRKLELTPGETPLLTLECPDYSSGTFSLTFQGTFVTSKPAARARKTPKR
jgi:hypothetical protein